jgi:LysM repeat protein
MTYSFLLTGIFAILSAMTFCFQAISAQEDSAQLTFRKTAVSRKAIQYHTVRENEALYGIIRKLPGVAEKDIPRYFQMIKALNSQVKDWDKIYPGQKIALPSKSIAGVQKGETAAASEVHSSGASGDRTYRVKKGDYLIRIVHRKLNTPSNTQQAMLRIKELNPSMKDANLLYPGQVIRLPGDQKQPPISVPIVTDETRPAPTAQTEDQFPQTDRAGPDAAMMQEEQPALGEKAESGIEPSPLSPGAKLEIIRHVVTQMHGNLTTKGNYYLPVSRIAQLTIDCSTIPVLELNDQTTIFLDMKNRSNLPLRKFISSRGSNWHIVKIDIKDDVIVMLKKIFAKSKGYEIIKAEKPLTVDSQPDVEIPVDWLINRKSTAQPPKTIQGLRLVYQNHDFLPRAITHFARANSLILTEFSPSEGLISRQEELYSLPPLKVLPRSPAGDLSLALLSYLKLPAEKDVKIQVFNIEKDGFNLSIKVDVLVVRGEKKTIISSNPLPPEFIQALRRAGHELIFVFDQDDPVTNLEKILRGVNIPFASGYFLFSGTDNNQPPYTIGFQGIKIKTDRDIYVVHFDFYPDLLGLLKEAWSADLVRY